MSGELRFDRLTGEWISIVGHRQARPNLPDGACPFCVGGVEAPAAYTVRAFENRWPAYTAGAPVDVAPPTFDATGDDGPFTSRPARGAAEVVLYSPDHGGSLATIGVAAVRTVVNCWAERTAELLARPEIASVLVFENRGAEVGATIDHPHGQIYAFPFVPPAERTEDRACGELPGGFADLVAAEIEADARIVATRGDWVAWVPFASPAPYGLLVAPRTAVPGLPELAAPGRDDLAALLADVVTRYDGLFDRTFPYLMWIHQAPSAELRTGLEHLHVHFVPPWRAEGVWRHLAAGELGSGTLSNPVSPETAAAALRDVAR